MGEKTLNDFFYKPSLGASGAVEKGKFDDALDVADAQIKANKDGLAGVHTQGTDADLDATFEALFVKKADTVNVLSDITSPGANIEDAVTKKHTQNTDTDLDATFEATFAKKADKLSVFAATTSAELAGVISDETGSGALNFGPPGYASGAMAYPSTAQQVVAKDTELRILLDTESFDVLGEFNSTVKTGTTTATSAGHLIDTTLSPFVAGDVGRAVWNTTDNTYTTITVYNSASDVTVANNIFTSGEGYKAHFSRFITTTTGYYFFAGGVFYYPSVASGSYQCQVRKNGTVLQSMIGDVIGTGGITVQTSGMAYLAAGDYLELWTYQITTGTTAQLINDTRTFLTVKRLY